MPKFNCAHADTCLPDYWSGHHRPHVSIPVYRGMHIAQVRAALHSEVSAGAIAGQWMDSEATEADYKALHAAINRDVKHAQKGKRRAFEDLEESRDDDCDSVYAYFVFIKD